MARIAVAECWTGIDKAARCDESLLIEAYVRGGAVLRAFRPGKDCLSNAEIAEHASIRRPTISRVSQMLSALGLVNYSSTPGQYSLCALATLRHSLLALIPYRLASQPYLQALAEISRDQLDMVYIATARCADTRPPGFDLAVRSPRMALCWRQIAAGPLGT